MIVIHLYIHIHIDVNVPRLNNLFTVIYFISLSVSTNNSARNLVTRAQSKCGCYHTELK